jgi:hypothetical protein
VRSGGAALSGAQGIPSVLSDTRLVERGPVLLIKSAGRGAPGCSVSLRDYGKFRLLSRMPQVLVLPGAPPFHFPRF